MSYSPEYLKAQKDWLLARRQRILNNHGDRNSSQPMGDIGRIDFAIKQIDEGKYGICPSCGVVNEVDRLDVIPEAVYCLKCRDRK